MGEVEYGDDGEDEDAADEAKMTLFANVTIADAGCSITYSAKM